MCGLHFLSTPSKSSFAPPIHKSTGQNLFSGGFIGGSVRMKLWSSLSTRRYLPRRCTVVLSGSSNKLYQFASAYGDKQ